MIETVQNNPEERRIAPHRRRVLRGAVVFYAENTITARCMIRDLTPYGAQLKILQEVPIPDTAILHLETDEIRIPFKAAWRRGKLIGVKFDEPYFSAVEAAEMENNVTIRTKRTNSLVKH